MAERRADLDVVGFLSSNLGLGVVARRWIRALAAAGLRVRAVDVADYYGRRLPGASPEAGCGRSLEPACFRLIVVNPPQLPFVEEVLDLHARGVRNALVPFWELDRLPEDWIPALKSMDRVVASSRFIAETLGDGLPAESVVWAPPPLFEREVVCPDRARFGIPPGATVFSTSFEVASGTERKNPWGVVEAFERAFPARRDVHLALKMNNPEPAPPAVERLRGWARSEPRASLLERPLDDEAMRVWLAGSDVFVSLHRAEGLGLPILESMALGIATIATASSGNLDFTTPDNAALVGSRPTPVHAETQPIYAALPGGTWAEPDRDEAAQWMRTLADDPALRRQLATRGCADAWRYAAPAVAVARLREALAPLGLRA